jgi:hypothetical protein
MLDADLDQIASWILSVGFLSTCSHAAMRGKGPRLVSRHGPATEASPLSERSPFPTTVMNQSPLCPGSPQQPQQLRHDCQGKSSEELAENSLPWLLVRGKGDNQARDRRRNKRRWKASSSTRPSVVAVIARHRPCVLGTPDLGPQLSHRLWLRCRAPTSPRSSRTGSSASSMGWSE